MAATILQPTVSNRAMGFMTVVVTIPTTVDGASGATCNFVLPGAFAIGIQYQSADYNGKTVTIKAAPDGVNFNALPTSKSSGSNAMQSVATADTAFLNYQVSINGAPNATVTVTIIATLPRF